VDFRSFTHLTFDCYGTLIDWETGILNALRPVFDHHGVKSSDDEKLKAYALLEAECEQGAYKPYRQVLREVMAGIGDLFGFKPDPAEVDRLPDSVAEWLPFPDTVTALAKLKQSYKLAIISNIDDGLFAESARLLGVEFDAIITAEQVGSYKPDRRNFEIAVQRLGVSKDRLLHVAQSLYHDHVPAKELGFKTVRVNRPSILPGTGVTIPASAAPDLEVPDLASLVELIGL
jgi:2-haloacid dehalogenase